jgi:TRAP-type C4-dicarboxylate transport system permease small subunit
MTPATVDRIVDRAMQALERGLAVIFIAAVALNFANVCGRYLLGASILSAEELQIFAMIMMTFLGSVIVTWRRQHLRMDVLIEACPVWLRTLTRVAELLVFILICGFVFYQSYLYAGQMYVLERKSDMAEVPMWIPHGLVPVGFGLMLLIALWRGAVMLARRKVPLADSNPDADGSAG